MQVSYNNLFKKLIDKGLKKTEFAKEAGISSWDFSKVVKKRDYFDGKFIKDL